MKKFTFDVIAKDEIHLYEDDGTEYVFNSYSSMVIFLKNFSKKVGKVDVSDDLNLDVIFLEEGKVTKVFVDDPFVPGQLDGLWKLWENN